MTTIFVEIATARGSTPRDAGTAMAVTKAGTEGTIGGGALEHWAVTRAREILAAGRPGETVTLPLGPGLGQCCGGAVTLRFGHTPRPVDRPRGLVHEALPEGWRPDALWLWGAGHVGRAVVRACPPGAFRITWVDDAAGRFPDPVPDHVKAIPAADMPLFAARAPRGAHHLIFTYSHDIDLALCAALLGRGAERIGLIGSATKRARFRSRLAGLGLDPSRITCPIGDKSLGKHPDSIARGVVDALMTRQSEKATA